MGDILIRKIPTATLKRLKAEARRNDRSVQAELRSLIVESFGNRAPDYEAFLRSARRVARNVERRGAGRPQLDPAALVRARRDRPPDWVHGVFRR